MASKPTVSNNLTAADQLAQYRAAAKALAPQRSDSTFAITVGKAVAGVPNFFEDVSAVYKVERATRQ